jgi:hypothetical protein
MDLATGTDDLKAWEVADDIELESLSIRAIEHMKRRNYDPTYILDDLVNYIDNWTYTITDELGNAWNFAPGEGPIKLNQSKLYEAIIKSPAYKRLERELVSCLGLKAYGVYKLRW